MGHITCLSFSEEHEQEVPGKSGTFHTVHSELGHDASPMFLGSLGFYITKYMCRGTISRDSQDGRKEHAAGPEGGGAGLRGWGGSEPSVTTHPFA